LEESDLDKIEEQPEEDIEDGHDYLMTGVKIMLSDDSDQESDVDEGDDI